MSGWAGTALDTMKQVVDESTGQMIMVDKNAKEYKLDAQGNIINPPKADAPAPSPFGAAAGAGGSIGGGGFTFGGGGGGGSSSGGGGFVFGGAAAPAPAGGGFVFGGAPAPAPAAGGFVFGGAPAPAPAFGGSSTPAPEKRKAGATERQTAPKKRRMRELRLTGKETGEVMVVGNGDCGQLGMGEEDDDCRDSLTMVVVASLSAERVTSVACGGLHAAVLTLDGKLWTWGCNDDDVLGRGGNESVPELVRGALATLPVQAVSCGDSHTAALTRDGRVFTWGTYKDSNGYIGYSPDKQKAAAPEEVVMPGLGGGGVKMIASGVDHTVALAKDGKAAYAWGCGEHGQLGKTVTWEKATKKKHLLPARLHVAPSVPGVASAEERMGHVLNDNFKAFVRKLVEADGGCDLREACELYLEHKAQIGAPAGGGGDGNGAAADALRLKGVYCGAYHTFFLTESDNVYACGLNNMGQLGLGSLEPLFTGTPTLVEALEGEGVCQLVGGEHHSLALTADGAVFAFGRGDNSQLGLGDGEEQHTRPVKVGGLAGVPIRKLACGSNQNFAVAKSGDLYAWGFGEMGQLGNGRAGDERTPMLIEPAELAGRAVLHATSGGQHSVLLTMQSQD